MPHHRLLNLRAVSLALSLSLACVVTVSPIEPIPIWLVQARQGYHATETTRAMANHRRGSRAVLATRLRLRSQRLWRRSWQRVRQKWHHSREAGWCLLQICQERDQGDTACAATAILT